MSADVSDSPARQKLDSFGVAHVVFFGVFVVYMVCVWAFPEGFLFPVQSGMGLKGGLMISSGIIFVPLLILDVAAVLVGKLISSFCARRVALVIIWSLTVALVALHVTAWVNGLTIYGY